MQRLIYASVENEKRVKEISRCFIHYLSSSLSYVIHCHRSNSLVKLKMEDLFYKVIRSVRSEILQSIKRYIAVNPFKGNFPKIYFSSKKLVSLLFQCIRNFRSIDNPNKFS